MGEGEPRKRKAIQIDDAQEPSSTKIYKGNAILIDRLPVPHMEPVEEVLSIEFFPGKIGMTTKIEGRMEFEGQK